MIVKHKEAEITLILSGNEISNLEYHLLNYLKLSDIDVVDVEQVRSLYESIYKIRVQTVGLTNDELKKFIE